MLDPVEYRGPPAELTILFKTGRPTKFAAIKTDTQLMNLGWWP